MSETKQSNIIQLMRPGALGDLLMCTSVLPELKHQGYFVRFVADPKYASILENHPLIDELVLSEGGTRQEMLDDTTHLLKAARSVYLYYPFYTKGMLPAHPLPMHLTSYFAEQTGVTGSTELTMGLSDEHESWGDEYKDTVLIHTQSLWSPYKNWPRDRWQALAERIQSDFGLTLLQLGAPDDPPIEGVKRLENPSIHHAIAALKQCKLFIGVDSVFNHASRAVKKPSIILWGSTHPSAMGYRQNLNLVNGVAWQPEMGLYGPTLHCQPCYREYPLTKNGASKTACPYTVPYPMSNGKALPKRMHPKPELNACMASQSVDVVYEHVKAMLENPDHIKELSCKPMRNNES